MSTIVDDGVVLRRINYAEADRILTVLTREHGKLGVIARGARRPRARMASHTDIFAHSRMQLASGRGELMTLTQAQRLDQGAILSDPVRTACAAVITELTDRVIEPHHADVEAYLLLVEALQACLHSPQDPAQALAWFARRLIDRLGYAPQLQACVACQEPLAEAVAWFSASGGGLLCGTCHRIDGNAVECPVRVIKVLRCIASADAATYWRLNLDAATLRTLEDVVERELAEHLERNLRSFEVLRQLRA